MSDLSTALIGGDLNRHAGARARPRAQLGLEPLNPSPGRSAGRSDVVGNGRRQVRQGIGFGTDAEGMMVTKRVALYLRVSTLNGQATENQQRELEAVASRSGWRIVRVFEDNGISGAKGRDRRPGLDQMMKAATRREFDLIAAWSVDRLGRSLQHLVQIFSELQALGVDLYLHQQHVDSSTPSGKALLQMSAVFAEFERAMLRERVNAGLARAKASGKRLGRPRAKGATVRRIRQLRAQGMGMVAIARKLHCGGGTVQRALKEAG